MIDPKQPGHFYAGLDAGESSDSGVWETSDGGEHWRSLPGMRGSRIYSLAFAPSDPRVIAAGTFKGVFLSTDAGAAWKRISRESDPEMQDITALAFDPGDTHTIYAGTPHLPWKTSNGGETWRSIATGLIDDSDIFSIRINPSRRDLVFASACSGIYRSDSGGNSWIKIKGIQGTNRRTHIIAEDPSHPDTIYAGTTIGLYKSLDAGLTWQHLSFEQVNWMVFDPHDSQTLYLATENAGVLKSTDAGLTMHPINAGFANHRLSQITSDGKRLYASSMYEGLYGGVFISTNGGLNWSLRTNEVGLLQRNLHSLTASPGDTAVFAASEDAVLKSTNAGLSWEEVPGPRLSLSPAPRRTGRLPVSVRTLRIYALRAVALDKPTLFAGTDAGLFRSSNQGVSWEQVKAAGITGVPMQAIYAPSTGASRLAVRTNTGLLISTDAGRTWQSAALPENYYLYDLALPISRDVAILAATSRGLLRSDDEGGHWKLVTQGLPQATVDSVQFNPAQKSEAFLVQYGAVYRSADGGQSWQPFSNDGLQNAAIRTLWFAPDLPQRIFALTAARGALVFDLPQAEAANAGDHAVISRSN